MEPMSGIEWAVTRNAVLDAANDNWREAVRCYDRNDLRNGDFWASRIEALKSAYDKLEYVDVDFSASIWRP